MRGLLALYVTLAPPWRSNARKRRPARWIAGGKRFLQTFVDLLLVGLYNHHASALERTATGGHVTGRGAGMVLQLL